MPPRPPLDQLSPRRICLIKPSALGDVVQTLPVLTGLRRRWPDAHIAWVINNSLANLLLGHPDLDEVIEFRRQGKWHQKTFALLGLAKRLYQQKFDLVLDLQGLLRSGLMTWATRARQRVGFADAREGATFAYTDKIKVPRHQQSAVLCNWEIARALGCGEHPPRPQLPVDEPSRQWARARVASLPRPLLILHPGAQWETKRWPPEHFLSLARKAQRELGAGIVLVGGPGEGALCQPLEVGLQPNVINVAERTSLKQLAAVIAEGNVFLSGDSGPMHMAAALGVPTVSVFTCTSPVRAGPFGEGHRIVATGVACAASYIKTCPSMICMEELTPARVWPALKATLSEVARSLARASGW